LGQLLNFRFENFEVSFGIEGFSCRLLNKVGGGIAATVGVDLLAKPAKEGLIVSVVDGGGEGGEIPLGGLPKLGGGQIAESVGGEVAKASEGPVDVLEATARIVRNFDAEQFFKKLVPCGGEIADSEISIKELRFQFKAQEDVEIVGDFIGFDPDEGAFYGIGGAPALLVVPAGQVGKSLNEVGPPGFPERAGSANAVFPKAGLGFVDAERCGLAKRGAKLRFGETLVVKSVASFVKDAVEGDHKVGFIVAGGHAGIAWAKAGAEGVGAGVETTRGDVESNFWQEGVEELFLIWAGIMTAKIRTGGRRGKEESFFGNRDEAWAEFFEKSSYVFSEPAWFVAFKKSIVGLVGIAPEIGHLARKGEKFFEMRSKGREVGVFAGLDPCGA
jgi:hypothetical protein